LNRNRLRSSVERADADAGARTAQLVAGAPKRGYRHADLAALLLEQARRAGMTLTAEQAGIDDGLGVGAGE